MVVNISRNILPSQADPRLLHLNDPGCGVRHVDERSVMIESPLEGCGTIRRYFKKKALTKTSLLKITPDSRGCILIWESFSANRASSRRTIFFISFFLPLFQTRYCLPCRHPQPPPKFYLFDGCAVVLNRRIRGSP